MAAFTIIASILGVIAIFAAAVYFIGVPAEWKQAAEQNVLEKMGEHKAKDMLKDQLSKVPEADDQTADKMQKGLGSVTSGFQKKGE